MESKIGLIKFRSILSEIDFGDTVEQNISSLKIEEKWLISPSEAALLIGVERATIYDMNYRPAKYGISQPDDLFKKNGRLLRIVTDKLKDWLISRNGGKP